MHAQQNPPGILLTSAEAERIVDFIRDALGFQWDSYTSTFICSDSREDGMKRMNPEMYEFANQLQQQTFQVDDPS